MTAPTAHLPAPALELRDGMPTSSTFDDVYFSRAGGIAETEHVFLRGNDLPARWQEASSFTLAELGFGTGLNFLVTLRCFAQTSAADARLHYIAIEQYPFTPAQLAALLAHFPELAEEAQALRAAYPLRLPGIHRLNLGRVTLTLCFGDAVEMLKELAMRDRPFIDAWYLDGFSPAKNPGMWGEEIYRYMQRLSAPHATFATFTVASHVRRGLAAVGFTVSKTRGFGHKREMSVGVLHRVGEEGRHHDAVKLLSDRILIIGAGIAGATLARTLAERGFAVTVIERQQVAGGASGNRAGVLFPQITKHWGIPSAWYFAAYSYALRTLAHWQAEGLDFTCVPCGMLRLPRHSEEEILLQQLHQTHGLDASIVHWLDRDRASAQAGAPLMTGAAFFPEGTWLNPRELCTALLQHENITLREQVGVTSLARAGENWQLTLSGGAVMETPLCSITAAHESAELLTDYSLTLGRVGGQISEFKGENAAANLRSILCHSGYVIPLGDSLLVGATYHRDDMLTVTDARHAENRAAIAAILPDKSDREILGGRSSIRATTPDRMPYVGALDRGLYVATGFGSRGLLSAPLAAEIIASDIAGEMPPVTHALLRALNPLRFKKK